MTTETVPVPRELLEKIRTQMNEYFSVTYCATIAEIDEVLLTEHPKPFRITGPGRYRRRDGRVVSVEGPLSDHCETVELGAHHDPENGPRQQYTIGIGGKPVEFKEESAGLRGFVTQYGDWSLTLEDAEKLFCDGDGTYIIDLSKVPKSALVDRKPKTVSGWLNIYDRARPEYEDADAEAHTGVAVWKTKEESLQAAENANEDFGAKCIACIRVEFTIGEGLVGVS
jgi:hypothetical protein